MDDRAWLYYKLTNEPKGSGELKTNSNTLTIHWLYRKSRGDSYVNIKCWRSKGIQEKESIMVVRCGQKNPSLGITVWHHPAKPCESKQWPSDGFFYPDLPPMKDSYSLTCMIICWVQRKLFKHKASGSGNETWLLFLCFCTIPLKKKCLENTNLGNHKNAINNEVISQNHKTTNTHSSWAIYS